MLAVAGIGVAWHVVLFSSDALLPAIAPAWFPDLGALVVNLVAAAATAWVLWRLGWLRSAGFTTLGRVDRYWIALPFLVLPSLYLLTGVEGDAPELIGGLVMLTLGVGLSEELYSRGLSLRVARGLTPLLACAWVGFVFGAGHFLSALWFGRPLDDAALQVVLAGVHGFIFCAARIAIGSLWPLIVAHGYDDWALLKTPDELPTWWLATSAILAIGYALFLLRRYGHELSDPTGITRGAGTVLGCDAAEPSPAH